MTQAFDKAFAIRHLGFPQEVPELGEDLLDDRMGTYRDLVDPTGSEKFRKYVKKALARRTNPERAASWVGQWVHPTVWRETDPRFGASPEFGVSRV